MPISAADLEADARRDSDTQRTRFVTSDDFLGWANDALRSLWKLIDFAKQPHFCERVDFQITSGNEITIEDALDDEDARFEREVAIEKSPDTSSACSVFPLDSFHERLTTHEFKYWLSGRDISFWPRAAALGSYRMYYVGSCPQLVEAEEEEETSTLPVEFERFREYITAYMARKAIMKRKQDTAAIDVTIRDLSAQVNIAASNRRAEPRKIPMPRSERRARRDWPYGD